MVKLSAHNLDPEGMHISREHCILLSIQKSADVIKEKNSMPTQAYGKITEVWHLRTSHLLEILALEAC